MHLRNRDLVAKRPDENALDPNRINASRLEILRTLLGVEAQLDQSKAVKNEIELDKFREQQSRREQAQAMLALRKAELEELDREILELSVGLAQLEAEDALADAARGKSPPAEEDRQRKLNIAGMKKRLELLQADRTRRATEIASLETAATKDITSPTFETPTLSGETAGANPAFPASEALTGFVNKALEGVGSPSLGASIALDNYVHIQYEIIAKQLTLLRDEVGPEERVVFLELPTSLYTVDKRANRYIAQVTWKVRKVFDEEPPPEVQREIICRNLLNEGLSPGSILAVLENLPGMNGMKANWPDLGRGPCLSWLQEEILKLVQKKVPQEIRSRYSPAFAGEPGKAPADKENWSLDVWQERVPFQGLFHKADSREEEIEARKTIRAAVHRLADAADAKDRQANEYPITIDMIRLGEAFKQWERDKATAEGAEDACEARLLRSEKTLEKCEEERRKGETGGEHLTDGKARTLEIVPRQSALNVNQYHATTSYKGILGILKLLSGFGAKVSYQSQREMYENFLQQEVFASGFGKGLDTFGWTFGPQPGSQRISPGQRTTYAVLAVPKNALALELEATGRAFRKRWEPEDGETIDRQSFLVRIPNDKTERFWVQSVSYTPVRQGPVTVHLGGSYFSPQLGVLINGVPLKRSVSVTRATIGDPPFARTNSGVEGEYEVPNSREMILNFSMGPGFVGTPVITLVTPERVTSINNLPLEINFRKRRLERLEGVAEREPFFVDRLELVQKLETLRPSEIGIDSDDKSCNVEGFTLARVRGKGLLPEARFAVAGVALPRRFSRGKLASYACSGTPFAFQESTGSYLLFFSKQGKRFKVRCRQGSGQSLEEIEFEEVPSTGVAFSHKVRNYRRAPDGRAAEVDLTFILPEARVNKATTLKVLLEDPKPRDSSTGCFDPRRDQNDDFRAKCRIPFERGVERDFISLKVVASVPKPSPETEQPMGKAGNKKQNANTNEKPKEKETIEPVTRFVDIQLPVGTRLERVANLRTGKPRTDSRQEAKAVLRGENLHRVTGVLFGEQSAPIDGTRAPEVLVVQVPRVRVEPGQEVVVPVTLQTDTGALSTGLFFTYEGPPEPEE